MKKIYLLLLLFGFNCTSQIKYGFKGGLNLTNADTGIDFLNRSFGISTSPKASFYLGTFTEIPFKKNKKFSLQLELLFNQNGTSIDKKSLDQTTDIDYETNGGKINVSQLDLTILIKFYPKKNFSLNFGLYTGYVLDVKSKNTNGITLKAEKSKINRFDYGFIVGASYYLKNNLFFEFSYNHGFSDLDKTKETYPDFGDLSSFYKNRTLHFGIGYKLN